MFRVTVSTNAAAATEYFLGGNVDELMGWSEWATGTWIGRGAELLGLEGPVTKKDFRSLADNVYPKTGEQLTPRLRADRRVGFDFNFHVPKSVSVLAMVVGDEALIQATIEAGDFVIRSMQQYVETRVRTDGRYEDRVTWGTWWRHAF